MLTTLLYRWQLQVESNSHNMVHLRYAKSGVLQPLQVHRQHHLQNGITVQIIWPVREISGYMSIRENSTDENKTVEPLYKTLSALDDTNKRVHKFLSVRKNKPAFIPRFAGRARDTMFCCWRFMLSLLLPRGDMPDNNDEPASTLTK